MRRRPSFSVNARRAAGEVALALATGALLGALGPFETGFVPTEARFLFWTTCVGGGAAIGVALDESIRMRVPSLWRRTVVAALLMTPPLAAFVLLTSHALLGQRLAMPRYLTLLWQVLLIALPVMIVRALVWRAPTAEIRIETIVATRTVVAHPTPEAEIGFRRRLSIARRAAPLIAIEAHDHYVRVHTDAGMELLTMRFAEAMHELEGVNGLRLHRSWWVPFDALEAVYWRRGAGEARLRGGLVAPVSRTFAPAVRAAGWF